MAWRHTLTIAPHKPVSNGKSCQTKKMSGHGYLSPIMYGVKIIFDLSKSYFMLVYLTDICDLGEVEID